ncbi:MAG: hypothetical protein ACW99A_08530 [Candidatus Kariarchaeaceae archaeon]|jgi:hypothetical protein
MKDETALLTVKLVEFKIRFVRACLFGTAIADGILTDEEIDMLLSIDFNLDLLHYAVLKAYEDQKITKEEKIELNEILIKIEDDAISKAKFSTCITRDNNRLLKVLEIVLLEFHKLLLR